MPTMAMGSLSLRIFPSLPMFVGTYWLVSESNVAASTRNGLPSLSESLGVSILCGDIVLEVCLIRVRYW